MPVDISKIIYEYWEETGQLIKNYRDIDQHWHQIVKRTWMELQADIKIKVILPDSKESLIYEKNIDF